MSLKDKSILVTGGAGFIGSHLVDRLIKEEPSKIIVASNFFLGSVKNLKESQENFPELKIIRCDVADYEDIEEVVKEHNFDVVFNLSVIPLPTSLVRPEWTIMKNVEMTLNICKLLREGKFKKLIQFSSSEVPGSAKIVPMPEDHPLNPETPYAASKAATDHIALSYHHTFGCDVSVVRPFNQYGPRQNAKRYAGIIPLMIGRIMRNEPLIIYGDGEQTRDFLYVTETADAVVEVAKCPEAVGKIINIASGMEISMNHVVKSIANLMNYDKPIIYKDARPGDVRRHIADVTLAKNILNWEPKL
ncbi:MAG: SDR family NAD(P)-dependent oxidoreductase, partial [Candidatus Woesearchaeota archaeon]